MKTIYNISGLTLAVFFCLAVQVSAQFSLRNLGSAQYSATWEHASVTVINKDIPNVVPLAKTACWDRLLEGVLLENYLFLI